MVKHRFKRSQPLDMFSPEHYRTAAEEAYCNLGEAELSDNNEELFERASSLHVHAPLVNVGIERQPFSELDLRSLALVALNYSIHSVGLGDIADGGVRRETMIEALTASINDQFRVHPKNLEQPSLVETERYANDLIKQLLQPATSFVYHAASKSFKEIKTEVLIEVDDHYGNFYIRPSIQSTNLFLSSLNISLTDDQIMLQALLEHQIKRGMVENAFQTARKLNKRTRFYKEEVRNLKNDISRKAFLMNWGEHIGSKINEIQEVLPDLLKTNREILKSIESNFELRQSERGQMVGALIREIKECCDTHNQLQNEVQSLDRLYQEEMERYAFVSSYRRMLPSMMDDVLVPLMHLESKYLDEISETLFTILTPPRATQTYDLNTMVIDALKEKKKHESQTALEEPLDLQEAPRAEKPNFTKEDTNLAVEFITGVLKKGPANLSEILEKGSEAGLGIPVLHAIALTTTIYWSEGDYLARWSIEKLNGKFFNEICRSDDFLLTDITERGSNE